MWASRSVQLEAVRLLGTQKDQGGKRFCARPLSFGLIQRGEQNPCGFPNKVRS